MLLFLVCYLFIVILQLQPQLVIMYAFKVELLHCVAVQEGLPVYGYRIVAGIASYLRRNRQKF